MSLPSFSTQSELFSTAGLSSSLFCETDRYRLFGKLVYPRLAAERPRLENCYCPENGRTALEPVLMLGVSILQELDGVPDRQAVEMLHYHSGWNFALNRQLGDPVFHPTSLVHFRHRLQEHQQSALGFTTILDALQEAGLVSRQSRQRLDSTQMFARVARMSRLDCVRETLRLALQELEPAVQPEARPLFWVGLWERYVESQVDYRASTETLGRKLAEAGADAWQLLEWLGGPGQAERAVGSQEQLLKRVFAEQFDVVAGQPAPRPKPKEAVLVEGTPSVGSDGSQTAASTATDPAPVVTDPLPAEALARTAAVAAQQPELSAGLLTPTAVEPKGKGQLSSDRVQNPHDPDATYAVKGQGQHKKEHVGYKVQVAETVCEAVLAPGEPTRNFITGIVTHPAYESDEAGALKMEAEQAAMGLAKPPVQYVDGAYVSAHQLAKAAAEGREIIGPAPGAPDNNDGRFRTEQFQVNVEERKAVCPAGKENTQCSRLEESGTGKVSFRFEWSTHCGECPWREQCVGPKQKHRTIVVGEYHRALQARRQEQQTAGFKERMKHRNGIEGTQSELVRGHGLRRARYRGLAKAKLQNYFIGAACNVKRWIRREAWKIQQAVSGALAQGAATAVN
jgi:transposase